MGKGTLLSPLSILINLSFLLVYFALLGRNFYSNNDWRISRDRRYAFLWSPPVYKRRCRYWRRRMNFIRSPCTECGVSWKYPTFLLVDMSVVVLVMWMWIYANKLWVWGFDDGWNYWAKFCAGRLVGNSYRYLLCILK